MAKPLYLFLNNFNVLTNRTLMNHRNVLRALGVACVLMAPVSNLLAQAADSVQQPSSDDPWRHVEFNLISDVPGDNVASVLDEPSYGFSLLWMKHTAGSLFDGGIDVGFQPLGGLDTTFTVDVGGEAREADLVLRNQLAHAHYVLRTTLFPTKKVQPYAEVFGGIRGAFLGTTLRIEGQSARDIDTQLPGTDFNFSYGYAGGVRLQLGDRTCLNVRYAQMLHFEGDDAIEIIDMSDLVVDGDGNVTVGATETVELPEIAVRVGLAIQLGKGAKEGR